MSKNITNITTGRTINTEGLEEIAPGIFTGAIPQAEMPRYGMTKYVQTPTGPKQVLVTWSGFEKINKHLPGKLGVKLSVRVLRALVYSGLVKGSRVTPFHTEIDLSDLARHRAESSKPNFWNDKRRTAYSLGWQQVQLPGEDAEDE